jgi:hypothetical protein
MKRPLSQRSTIGESSTQTVCKSQSTKANAINTMSVVADRICMQGKKPIQLSAQEIINCDKSNYHCEGGYVTRTLNWGKRKGFIPEQCYAYNGTKGECDEDHLQDNECR